VTDAGGGGVGGDILPKSRVGISLEGAPGPDVGAADLGGGGEAARALPPMMSVEAIGAGLGSNCSVTVCSERGGSWITSVPVRSDAGGGGVKRGVGRALSTPRELSATRAGGGGGGSGAGGGPGGGGSDDAPMFVREEGAGPSTAGARPSGTAISTCVAEWCWCTGGTSISLVCSSSSWGGRGTMSLGR
jgi:hypothetical protein